MKVRVPVSSGRGRERGDAPQTPLELGHEVGVERERVDALHGGLREKGQYPCTRPNGEGPGGRKGSAQSFSASEKENVLLLVGLS